MKQQWQLDAEADAAQLRLFVFRETRGPIAWELRDCDASLGGRMRRVMQRPDTSHSRFMAHCLASAAFRACPGLREDE